MFRVIRVHPNLVVGDGGPATVASRKWPSQPVHLLQGELDGACGQHCAFMALLALGVARRRALRRALSGRSHRGIARMRRMALRSWHDGASVYEMARLLAPLRKRVGVQVSRASGGALISFVLGHLAQSNLVVVGISNAKADFDHWVLAVGSAGVQAGHKVVTDQILVLDPGWPPAATAQWNGVLDTRRISKRARARLYRDADGNQTPVKVKHALAIGLLAKRA